MRVLTLNLRQDLDRWPERLPLVVHAVAEADADVVAFQEVALSISQDRLLADALRVLRPGGLLVANDSVASEDLAAFHVDDVCNPVDPATLPGRLDAIGYTDIEVRSNPYAWACHARRPPVRPG